MFGIRNSVSGRIFQHVVQIDLIDADFIQKQFIHDFIKFRLFNQLLLVKSTSNSQSWVFARIRGKMKIKFHTRGFGFPAATAT